MKYLIVYRVNWHRAKARYSRWEEEVEIVCYEMECVVAWFLTQQMKWEKRREGEKERGRRGHECYAKKQLLLWKHMGNEA
jgi:hypothetical protein